MMDRLQKKCLIAAVASHGLLVTLLIVGPAFFIAPDRLDPHQTITVIPDTISDGPTQIHGQATPSEPAPALTGPCPASRAAGPASPAASARSGSQPTTARCACTDSLRIYARRTARASRNRVHPCKPAGTDSFVHPGASQPGCQRQGRR